MNDYCPILDRYCSSLHEHHIIPREFGGENGPTIFISPEAHQSLHRVFSLKKESERAKIIDLIPIKGRSLFLALLEKLDEAESLFNKLNMKKESHAITIKIDNMQYTTLKQMSIDFGVSMQDVLNEIIRRALS